MNGYVAFYNGKRLELYAETLCQAKLKAIQAFKVKPKQTHMISIVLVEKNDEQVTTVLN